MSNTPSKAEIEALVKRHGATSYRNRADTQHPAYGFTEDGLNGLIDEVLAKWGHPAHSGEPVAWLNPWRADQVTTDYDAYGKHGIPLYPPPQPTQAQAGAEPLTDAQYDAIYEALAASCRSTSEHWGGRWSIIIDGPAPESHDSEDDFDAAVDAARKQGGA